jgi:phage gp36-like protein
MLTKADLTPPLYQEIIDEISRNDDSKVTTAIKNGEGEAKSYLNRFDIATMFDASFDNEFFKGLVKDIVCWHLIKLANPNINLELFRTSYQDAVKYFKQVMKGEIDPGWPLRADDPATPNDDAGNIDWSSNTKRNNHY